MKRGFGFLRARSASFAASAADAFRFATVFNLRRAAARNLMAGVRPRTPAAYHNPFPATHAEVQTRAFHTVHSPLDPQPQKHPISQESPQGEEIWASPCKKREASCPQAWSPGADRHPLPARDALSLGHDS
jgi:hypothetical protein